MTTYRSPLICDTCGVAGDMPRGAAATAAGWRSVGYRNQKRSPCWECPACSSKPVSKRRPARVPMVASLALILAAGAK